MAAAVEHAIGRREHLIVEAGTGVGKSFAYLVPAILAATANQGTEAPRRRIVISTHTISLQEQLIQRDLPFLNAVLPVEFSAVLVKGRSNYHSLRRLKGAVTRSGQLFADPSELQQLQQIVDWSRTTTDGSLADLSFSPAHRFRPLIACGMKFKASTATAWGKAVRRTTLAFTIRLAGGSGMPTSWS
jgi:ATP-dependent DNA helicase DinG